jgi:hypothetical protein
MRFGQCGRHQSEQFFEFEVARPDAGSQSIHLLAMLISQPPSNWAQQDAYVSGGCLAPQGFGSQPARHLAAWDQVQNGKIWE